MSCGVVIRVLRERWLPVAGEGDGQAAGTEARIRERFPAAEVEVTPAGELAVKVAAAELLSLCRYLRDEEGFNYLSSLSGVDYREKLQVVLHLFAVDVAGVTTGKAVVRTDVPANEPRVPSVTEVWPTANWHEREAFDLLGIQFEDHPDLRRILLGEDFEGHPLRKDYAHNHPPRAEVKRE